MKVYRGGRRRLLVVHQLGLLLSTISIRSMLDRFSFIIGIFVLHLGSNYVLKSDHVCCANRISIIEKKWEAVELPLYAVGLYQVRVHFIRQ